MAQARKALTVERRWKSGEKDVLVASPLRTKSQKTNTSLVLIGVH